MTLIEFASSSQIVVAMPNQHRKPNRAVPVEYARGVTSTGAGESNPLKPPGVRQSRPIGYVQNFTRVALKRLLAEIILTKSSTKIP